MKNACSSLTVERFCEFFNNEMFFLKDTTRAARAYLGKKEY